MKRLFLILTVVVTTSLLSSAQDIHFSQFNASPLTLNPALTGKVPCTYRFVINYRNQWNSIPAPFETYSGAFDALLSGSKSNGQGFGIGAMVFNDVSGDGNLSHLNLGLSLAYHKQLGIGVSTLFSAGFQGTYSQKSINYNNLRFQDEIISGGPTGETFGADPQYFDLNMGVHWSTIVSDYFGFNLGGAYYHFLEPNETFLNNPSNTLGVRYVGHGGLSCILSDQIAIYPSMLFMTQSGVSETNIGSSLSYSLNETNIYFGSWYRLNDAVVALVGFEVSKLVLGFSYDISTSDVNAANNGKGGFELSLSYNGCIKFDPIRHCPQL